MKPIELYANRLKHCLAVNAGMNGEQVQAVVGKFHQAIAAQTAPDKAFKWALSEWGNEDVEQACASIQSELERLNREHAGIEANPLARLRRYVRQFNDKVGKLDIEVSGIDESKLTDHQRAQLEVARRDRKNITLTLPKVLTQEEKFVALAEHRGKPVKLELTVRY